MTSLDSRPLRPNPAKHKLRRGEPVLCPVPVANLDALEQLAARGFVDLAMIDMEHGPWAWSDIANFSRVCDLWAASSMVRVEANDETLIAKALDLGAQSVVIPHVCSAEEARRAVRGARYAPLGARGIGGPRQGLGVPDYWRNADQEIMVGVMIEDVEGLSELDAIAAVDGVDFIFLAPFDLAQSMGRLGEPFHPAVQDAVRGAIQRITALGLAAGTFVTDEVVEDYLTLGARLLFFTPIVYLYQGAARFQAAVNARMGALRPPGSSADKTR